MENEKIEWKRADMEKMLRNILEELRLLDERFDEISIACEQAIVQLESFLGKLRRSGNHEEA